MRKVFSRCLVSALLLLTSIVLLTAGMSGSAQAYDAHSPILILDNAGLISAGFPGTGTNADPFLIQNFEIDGAGGSAIAIYDTDLHVKILNCYLSDSSGPSATIHLQNVKNVTVENNTLVDCYAGVGLFNSHSNVVRNNTFVNHNTGIFLEDSDHNLLFNNTCVLDIESPSGRVGIQLRYSENNSLEENNCSGNNAGIDLFFSHFNTLSANICDDIEGSGMVIDSSMNNTIMENICRNNYIAGIVLQSSSSVTTGNVIDNNNCSGNALITEWGAGVFLSSSTTYDMSNNTISNNELSGNYYGIWVMNAPNNTISSNTVNDDVGSGIYISASSWNRIESNTITGNGDSGIWLDASDCCTVEFNVASGNFDGIYLESSENNVLQRNDLNGNNYGIYLYDSSYNSILFNECNDSVIDGIYLEYSNDNLIANNNCSGNNAGRGIFLFCSSLNTLQNNTCSGNSEGISLYSRTDAFSTENAIHNNTCNGNTNDGIKVQASCSYTTVTNNTCNDNKYGVHISGSIQCEVANNTCLRNLIGIVLMTESDWNAIDNNICSHNAQAGIYLSYSDNCLISYNTCDLSGQASYFHGGIVIDNSDDNMVSNNTCLGNPNAGVMVYQSLGNEVVNNTLGGNGNGIRTDDSDHGLISGNEIHDNYNGMYLYHSDGNQIIGNNCTSAGLYYSYTVGIMMDYCLSNDLINNECNHNAIGMHIKNSDLNIISNNNCDQNSYDLGIGIKIDGSYQNRISNNSCSYNSVGINGIYSDENEIIGNNCSDNIQCGINFYLGSSDNVISHNICNSNQYGMWLSAVVDSAVLNNTCNDNLHVGIFIEYRSKNNLISNNTIINNGYVLLVPGYPNNGAGNGLVIDGSGEYNSCDGNTISNNTIEGSNFYGIRILSSSGNLMFGNILRGNNNTTPAFDQMWVQAYDDGSNLWNATGHGNLWGDWASPDANGDGIVDEEYLIDGGTNKDLLPLAVSMSILSPADGVVTGDANMGISGIAVSYFGVAQVTWYNAATDGSGTCSGAEDWNATIALAEGENQITVTMTDLSGNQANTTITLVLDATPPALEITSPAEGAITGSSVTVTWTGSDDGSGISHYNISVDGGAWMTVTSPYAINALVQGGHVIVVRAFDLVGNVAIATVNITVDATAPNVEILTPANGYLNTTGSITITWTGNDTGSGIDHYEVSWEGMTPVSVSNATFTYTFNDLSDGPHVITVVAVDKAGLTSQDQVGLVVDSGAPSLAITSPAPGSFLNSGSVNIAWAAEDAGVGIANFTISRDGGAAVILDADVRSYQFSGLSEGVHTVYITATDLLGNSVQVNRTFTVDTVAPTLIIEGPEDGSYLNDTTVTVRWSSYDSYPGQAMVSLDNGSWAVANGSEFMLTALVGGTHTIRVNVTDQAGNHNESSVRFTVDLDPPTVALISPTEGSYSTSNTTFVEWLAEDAGSGIALVQISLDGVNWTTAWSGSYLTPVLDEGPATFHVRATDLAGNAATATVNFTVDSVAPTASVSPTGIWVKADALVVVTFSEQMNLSSVDLAIVGITGSVAWNGTTATFRHLAPLMYGCTYTVNVTGTDLAGNPIELSWSFTTEDYTTFTGRVRSAEGNNLQGVRVTISNGTVSESQLTGTDGTFTFGFAGNVSGTFTITLEKEGYLDLVLDNVTFTQGAINDLGTSSLEAQEDEEGGDGGIMLYAVMAIIALAAVGVAAYFFLKKK